MLSGASEFCPCPDAPDGEFCAGCPGRDGPRTAPGVIAEGVMMAPALWIVAPVTGAVLGVDGAGIAARLSIHPDDIARAALALCLAAEPAVIEAMRKETTP